MGWAPKGREGVGVYSYLEELLLQHLVVVGILLILLRAVLPLYTRPFFFRAFLFLIYRNLSVKITNGQACNLSRQPFPVPNRSQTCVSRKGWGIKCTGELQ